MKKFSFILRAQYFVILGKLPYFQGMPKMHGTTAAILLISVTLDLGLSSPNLFSQKTEKC